MRLGGSYGKRENIGSWGSGCSLRPQGGKLDSAACTLSRCRGRPDSASRKAYRKQMDATSWTCRPDCRGAGQKQGFARRHLKLKFILSFAAFFGFYWAAFGMKFGLGFAVLILIHEMGHFIDIKRRGLPAEMPVFLPGFGAYVRWRALGVSPETRAAISLAGPLAGFLASLACAMLWWQTGNVLWAALARAGAWLNLLNLIPVWVLDGGQAALALSKTERTLLLTACLALWLVLGEGIFFLVALGAGYQVFVSRDLPAHPSRATMVHFVAVLTALGVILHLMPGKGFGAN